MSTLTSTLRMGYLLLVFDVSHPYVRAQLYFSHEEADVLDLDLKVSVTPVKANTSLLLLSLIFIST